MEQLKYNKVFNVDLKTQKLFLNSKWLQYHLPLTLLLFTFVTIKWTVRTDGGFDRLYGFPLPYITNSYYASFHYDVFTGALLLDLLTCCAIVILLCKVVELTGLKLKTHPILLLPAIAVTAFCIFIFYSTTKESTFKLVNDIPYKTIKKELILGTD